MFSKKSTQLNYILKMVLCLPAVLICFTSCGNNNTDNLTVKEYSDTVLPSNITPITKSSFKLNTIVTITIYDSGNEELLEECMKLCDYYENLFSKTIAGSDIYKLNHEGTYTAAEKTSELIMKGLYYTELTGGVFNICIGSLTDLWDFINEKKVPEEEKIKSALSHIDYNNIVINENTYTFTDSEMKMDLGAIAKGYIADRIKDYLITQGVKSAIINLGGNVLLVGGKPDGSDFKIGIQKPFESYSETIAAMLLSDVSVVSSGVYERYFIEDEQLYHHIIDTSNGYPCNNELISVTIISKYSVDGDAISTSAFALGLEKGLEFINSLEDTYAVFITSDYELVYSEGFLGHITVTEE